MAKNLSELYWVEELLPSDYIRKPMFGGFAFYHGEYLKLVLFEHEGDRTYKNLKFDFDIWNGCMLPVEKERHAEVKKQFPFLINHPVLPKWLYIPIQSENFEENTRRVLSQLRRGNDLFGTIPKSKAKKKDQSPGTKIDLRRPRMFREESSEQYLRKAQKISDLKNLGPASEVQFKKAGINSAEQFIKLGWKKAMEKLVKSDPKNRHSLFAYALIGALTNTDWNRIPEVDKKAAREFTRSLQIVKKKSRTTLQAKKGRRSR